MTGGHASSVSRAQRAYRNFDMGFGLVGRFVRCGNGEAAELGGKQDRFHVGEAVQDAGNAPLAKGGFVETSGSLRRVIGHSRLRLLISCGFPSTLFFGLATARFEVQVSCMRKNLNLARFTIALPVPLNAYVSDLAVERGVQRAEIIREALTEWMERRMKLVPRQGRQRAAPPGQARMPLDQNAA